MRSARAADDRLDLAYDGFLDVGEHSMRLATARLAFVPTAARYRMQLDVDSLIGQLRYLSEGSFDAAGLHPDHYFERRSIPLRPSKVREVRFVGAGVADPGDGVLPVPAGTQDRLSIVGQVWWLARRHDPSVAPGARLSVPLAGFGAVDPVELQVDPPAPIEADGRSIVATRVHRAPGNAAEGDLDVEVWLETGGAMRPLAIRFRDGTRALRFVLTSRPA